MRQTEQRSKCWVAAGAMLAILLGWVAAKAWAAEDKPTKEAAKEPAAPSAKAAAKESEKAKDAQADMEAQMKAAMEAYEAEMRALRERLRSDPAWKASHAEVRVIQVGADLKPGGLHNFCLNLDGNILAGCGGERFEYVVDEKTQQAKPQKISEPAEIRVISPEGKLLQTWKPQVLPQALCVRADGVIFIGGDGKLARLSSDGKVLATADSPAVVPEKPQPKPEEKPQQQEKPPQQKTASSGVLGALLKAVGLADEGQEKVDPEVEAAMAAAMARRRLEVTGIAVTDKDLFLACPMREGWGYAVWRMDHDFKNPVEIVKNLSGCCGQMDIQAKDGELWIPENGRHRVSRYDRDGKLLGSFGKRDRKAAEGFGGCCEPKNLRFGPGGEVYTAESGPPVAVKRFSPEGKFLGVVAVPTFKTGCVRVTVEVSRDGTQVFILNPGENAIHVLKARSDAQ